LRSISMFGLPHAYPGYAGKGMPPINRKKVKVMSVMLNDRNKRALIILGVSVAAILGFRYVVSPAMDQWDADKELLGEKQEQLALLSSIINPTAKQKNINDVVPAFEVPATEDDQRVLFARKFNEQLKQAGVSFGSQKYTIKGKKLASSGLKPLKYECKKGGGNFNQIVTLLEKLDENPYLLSVEELKLQCGKKKREKMTITMTLSTLIRQ